MKEFLRQHIEKISKLSDEEFDYVFSHFTTKKLKKGDFLIKAGEKVTSIHLVFSGCLKAYYINDNAKLHVIRFAMEDWWVTDFQAFYHKTPAILNIDCIEDSELLCITLENREKLCNEMHAVEHFFFKKQNASYIAVHQRLLSLMNDNAKERYETLISKYPEIIKRIPKHLIAAYLGVTRETLSRLYLNK